MSSPDQPVLRDERRSQWSRILWLDRRIREGVYPDVCALQAEFGVSRRTALDAVSFLRYSLHAPVAYSRQRKGYFYEDATYALPGVLLAEGELLALLVAEKASREYVGTPLEAPMRAAIQKL